MWRTAQYKARALSILLGFLFVILPFEDSAQSQSNQDRLHFCFAFGAQTVVEGGRRLVSVETEAVLKSGDLLKFFLQTDTEIYFYLFHLSCKGSLTLLSPVKNQSSRLNSDTQIYVPEGAMWLELDANTGVEKFFLIASSTKLERIKKLYENHTGLENKSAIQSSTASILSEISKLNQMHRKLSAPAENPVRLAGRVRDPNKTDTPVVPDISSLAIEVIAHGIYSKTFNIDHR
jgi:hypothetical protein